MQTGKALHALLLAAALAPFGAAGASGQSAPQGDVAKKLVGAWRYIGTWVDGVPRDRGPNPTGMIIYLPSGHMAVQIAPDRERKKAGREVTPEEAKFALAGIVTHNRQASIQPGDVAPLVRVYEFNGDRLTLRPPNSKQEIVWERIK